MRPVSITELKRIRDSIFKWLDNPDHLEPNSMEIATLCNAVHTDNFSVIELFNLPTTASQSDIRTAYKKYILKTHPDKVFLVAKMCLYIEITGLLNVAWEKTSGKFDPEQAAPAAEPATAAAATSFAAEMGDTVSASWEEIPCFTKIGDYSKLSYPDADHLFEKETNKFIEALANIESPQDFAQWIYAQRGIFPGPIANTRGASLYPIMEFLTKAANKKFFTTWKGYYLLTAMQPIMSQIFSGSGKDCIEHEFLATNNFSEGAYGATDALIFFLKKNRRLFKPEKMKAHSATLSGFLEKFSAKQEVLLDLNENFIPIFEIFNTPDALEVLFAFPKLHNPRPDQKEGCLYIYRTFIHENLMRKVHQERNDFFHPEYPKIFKLLYAFSLSPFRFSIVDDSLYQLMLTDLSDLFPAEFCINHSTQLALSSAAAAESSESSHALTLHSSALTLYSSASSRTVDSFDWFAKKLFLIRDGYSWPPRYEDYIWHRFLNALPQERHTQISLKLIASAAKALNHYVSSCNANNRAAYPGPLRPFLFAYTAFNPSDIQRQAARLNAICNPTQFNLNDVRNIIADVERLDKKAGELDEIIILKKMCQFIAASRPAQAAERTPTLEMSR